MVLLGRSCVCPTLVQGAGSIATTTHVIAIAIAAAALLAAAVQASAQHDAGFFLPQPRLEADTAGLESSTPAAPPLPRPRPPRVPEPLENQVSPAETESLDTPPRLYQTACPALIDGTIVAKMLPPIDDGICQVRSPLLVSAVNIGGREVTLSTPTITTCGMAGQLARWAGRFDAYAAVVFRSYLTSLLAGTGYDCRPRNNLESGDVSEHGFANALDIAGFVLESGTRVSLPEDWSGDDPEAAAMRYAHASACGLFTTVLGPGANALHDDHLHLDLGCHGQSCTHRLCE
ncbi:MAG: extensin family protein [Alphaproteobacteria bacterium]|nr:extensin family protein [Alphaproteobacteria bacterium]